MGSTMKPTIFNDRVATALKNWSRTAKKKKHGHYHSEGNSPFSSRPASPSHGMSPVHLLHNYQQRNVDSLHTSPRKSDANENDRWNMSELPIISPRNRRSVDPRDDLKPSFLQPGSSSQSADVRTQHEIDMAPVSDFSFRKTGWAKLINKEILKSYDYQIRPYIFVPN